MAKKNRECLTCGAKYSYCPNCNRREPSWMAEFHAENCKNIFQICIQHNVGLLAKEDAQVALNACDLSNKDSFSPCVKQDFEKIFADESKKRGKRAEMHIVEEAVDTEVHEVVE